MRFNVVNLATGDNMSTSIEAKNADEAVISTYCVETLGEEYDSVMYAELLPMVERGRLCTTCGDWTVFTIGRSPTADEFSAAYPEWVYA